MDTNRKSWKKWILTILAILLLFSGMLFGLQKYGESYLQENVPALGDRLGYELALEGLNLSIWQNGVTLDGITAVRKPAEPDSASWAQFTTNTVSIEGVHLWSWLWGDTLTVGRVAIEKPAISLKGRTNDFKTEKTFFEQASSSDKSPPVNVHLFELTGGTATLLHPQDSSKIAGIGDVNVQLRDLVIPSSSFGNRRRSPLQYGEIHVEFSELYSHTPKEFYKLSLKKGRLSSRDSLIILDSLVVNPRFPKHEFAREFGYETDRIDLLIPQISIHRLDPGALANARLVADRVQLLHPKMEIFHDKHMPFPSKPHRPLPQQQLRDLPLSIKLDTITVEEARITYSEHRPHVDDPGTVVFGDLNASIYNMSNDSTQAAPDSIILEAQTSIMDAAPLQVKATLTPDESAHRVEGTLGSMPMQELNAVTEPLGLVSITSGQIQALDFAMQLDDRAATGTVLLEYSDLKIEVLDQEKNENTHEKQLLSLLANTFKVKSNNDKPLREGSVSFKRDPQKSIFSYWWKALLSGLKSSIGL